MAHLGEAQGIIDSFKLKKIEHHLYQSESLLLLLTGEGPFEANSTTSFILGKNRISKVINLGIAGSLKPELKVGDIHPVRTIYLVNDLKPAFKTFKGDDEGLDCVTSFERILDQEKAQKLRGMGHLVDREAWGVAFAAKTAGVPFRAYKLISDMAGTLGACELIREEAQSMSEKLAEFLKTIISDEAEATQSDFKIEGFHFTFTTAHQFQNLLTKVSIKLEKSKEEILLTLPLQKLLALEIAPKERARKLISEMEHLLDPTRRVLLEKKEEWLKDFKDSGIDVLTDPQWEDPKVTLRFQVENDEELKEKLESLKKVSLTPFKNLMEGKIHVE